MNNLERKKFILSKLTEKKPSDVFTALGIVGGDIDSLEAVPVGLTNRVTIICEDYMDGKIDEEDSIDQLKEFLLAIPDKP